MAGYRLAFAVFAALGVYVDCQLLEGEIATGCHGDNIFPKVADCHNRFLKMTPWGYPADCAHLKEYARCMFDEFTNCGEIGTSLAPYSQTIEEAKTNLGNYCSLPGKDGTVGILNGSNLKKNTGGQSAANGINAQVIAVLAAILSYMILVK